MKSILKYLIIFPILLINFSCDESTSGDTSAGVLVGTWKLTALSGTYIWDAIEADSLRVRWRDAATVLGADSANADQTLARFSIGQVLLNQTSELADTAALSAAGVGMTGVFTKQNTYSLSGTYPSLRTDTTSCTSYQADPAPQIADNGGYGVVYNSDNTGGVLTITAADVLPPFQDGTVTFTNDGNTVNLKFTDRDSHDTRCEEVGITAFDSDKRQTMGFSWSFIDPTTGAFTATAGTSMGPEAYLMSPLLATWSGYMTWNALQFNGCLATGASATTCTGLYGADDSVGDPFSLACLADGNLDDCAGKLMYKINNLCIGVNEIIEFDATFDRVSQ